MNHFYLRWSPSYLYVVANIFWYSSIMMINLKPNPTLIYLSWPRRLSDKRGNRGGGRLASHKHPDSRTENIFLEFEEMLFWNLTTYWQEIGFSQAFGIWRNNILKFDQIIIWRNISGKLASHKFPQWKIFFESWRNFTKYRREIGFSQALRFQNR